MNKIRTLHQIVAQVLGGLHGPCSNMMNMNQAEHPNIIENGKLMFWSLSRQAYVVSACQPRSRNVN